MVISKGILASAAFAAVALASPQAGAADIDPVTGYPIYVSIFGGASFLNDVDTNLGGFYDISWDTKTGYLVGGAIGIKWNDVIRTEIELSHASVKAKSADVTFGLFSGNSGAQGKIDSTYLLGNVWLDYHNSSDFTPYIGAGLGVGWADASLDIGSGLGLGDGEAGLAFQLGTGVKYDISDSIAIDLGYRFKGLSNIDFDNRPSISFKHKGGDLYSHNVQLGLTFSF